MSEEERSGQIDIALIIMGLSILIVGILYFFNVHVPGALLLILGICAIFVGALRIIVSLYYVLKK